MTDKLPIDSASYAERVVVALTAPCPSCGVAVGEPCRRYLSPYMVTLTTIAQQTPLQAGEFFHVSRLRAATGRVAVTHDLKPKRT